MTYEEYIGGSEYHPMIIHAKTAKNKRKDCVVVIPLYKEKATDFKPYERMSLQRVVDVLGDKYELVVMIPERIPDASLYSKMCGGYEFSFLRMQDCWFTSIYTYSNLCEKKWFYDIFKEYEYMMIYQTDAWICRDDIGKFINLGYDYYGSPHNITPTTPYSVGNGGFSLRKVETMCKITEIGEVHPYHNQMFPMEDVFISHTFAKMMKLPSVELAFEFGSCETGGSNKVIKGEIDPMGFHGIHRWGMEQLTWRKNQRISLCCIAKRENKYIKDWIEHYLNIGVNKIFIYDNNEKDGEEFLPLLDDYVESNVVEIIDWRGRHGVPTQETAYEDCYRKHGHQYDWMMFFDCDEFLTLDDDIKDIHELLSHERYDNFDCIHFNWMCYGDNDILHYEDKPVYERFIIPLEKYFGENKHIKACVRGGLGEIVMLNPHCFRNRDIKTCDSNGTKVVGPYPFVDPPVHKNAYLKHFVTKSIEEFCETKIMRGRFNPKEKATLKLFGKFNELTDEKLQIYEKYEQFVEKC